MIFGSVCSGIEAASVAWHPLGWNCAFVAEIEPFPSALLAHHYPTVPNFGDLTKWREWPRDILGSIEVLVGGTPCQSFSVAGLRAGLADARGNLMLSFIELANAIDDIRCDHGLEPIHILWENVPGVFSDKTNGFGALLGGLCGSDAAIPCPPRDGWSYAGVASGPRRVAAWRTLDAQFFGVAQRRRRVFVLARGGARAWQCADAILPLTEGLRGDTAPRRESREGLAPTISARTKGGGGLGTDFDCDGGLIPDIVGTLSDGAHNGGGLNGQDAYTGRIIPVPESGTKDGHLIPVTHALDSFSAGRATEDETGRGCPLVPVAMHETGQGFWQAGDIAGTLRAEGENRPSRPSNVVGVPVAFKASHYTRGKDGAPSDLAPPLSADADKGDQDTLIAFDTTQVTSAANYSNPKPGDPCHPLAAGADAPAIAFSCKDYGADAGELSPTLRSMNEEGGNANGGGQIAVAFESRFARNGRGAPSDIVPPLKAQSGESGKGDSAPLIAFADLADPVAANQARTYTREGSNNFRVSNVAIAPMAVRRLTPRECERLQGFPDDYTLIPHRGKPAADGPRYKALGNSMAVPVMRWIGKRIDAARAKVSK